MTFEQTLPSWTLCFFIFSRRSECRTFSTSFWTRRSAVHLQRLRPATGEQSVSLSPHPHHRNPHPHPALLARSLCFFSRSAAADQYQAHSKKEKKKKKRRSELSGGVSCVSVKVTEQTAKVCQRLSIPLAALPPSAVPTGRRPRFIRAPRK